MDVQQYVQLGLAGVCLYLMYKIVDRSLTSNQKLAESIDKNTAATNELYTYVKVRNGTLERLVQSDSQVKQAAKDTLDAQ